jgi:hypothetical protein
MEAFNHPEVEQDILEWINRARANPSVLVPYLEERLATFKDKAWKRGDKWFNSREGSVPVQEAIDFLKQQPALKKLRDSESMTKAAQEHAADMAATGITGHTGSNGSTMAKRVEKYGKWRGGLSENLAYQQTGGLDFLLYWVVDDGMPSRANRLNIFKADFGAFGVSVAAHPKQKTCAVLVLGGEIAEGEVGKEATMLENEYDKQGFGQLGVEGQVFNYGDMKKALVTDYKGELEMELIPGAVSVAEEKSIVMDGDREKVIIKKIYTMGDGSLQTVEKEVS